MSVQQKKLKSPLMSQSTYLNGVNQTNNEKQCQQCLFFHRELQQADQLLQQYMNSKNVDAITNQILNENRQLKRRIQDLEINALKLQKRNAELQTDIQATEQKFHMDSISKGEFQRMNMNLKQQILQLEKQLLLSDQSDYRFGNHQEIIDKLSEEIESLSKQVNEQKTAIAQKQKFVESVLHMVVSCHPEDYFEETPSLKQAWKWLKKVLQEYVYLKKVYKSEQVSATNIKQETIQSAPRTRVNN